MDEIKIKHRDIEIVYDERDNLFRFTLRGRERSADSLRAAKEAIDKPEPKEKRPFTRTPCWYKRWSEDFKSVDITSIAENCYGSSTDVWIVHNDKNKEREKVMASNLYPVNARNSPLVSQWRELKAQIEALSKQQAKLMDRMQCFEIPAEEKE